MALGAIPKADDAAVSAFVAEWMRVYGLATRVKTDKKVVSYEEGRRRGGVFWRNSVRQVSYFHPHKLVVVAWDHSPTTRNMSDDSMVAL